MDEFRDNLSRKSFRASGLVEIAQARYCLACLGSQADPYSSTAGKKTGCWYKTSSRMGKYGWMGQKGVINIPSEDEFAI